MEQEYKNTLKRELPKRHNYINKNDSYAIFFSFLMFIALVLTIVFLALFIVNKNNYMHGIAALNKHASDEKIVNKQAQINANYQMAYLTYRDLFIVFLIVWLLCTACSAFFGFITTKSLQAYIEFVTKNGLADQKYLDIIKWTRSGTIASYTLFGVIINSCFYLIGFQHNNVLFKNVLDHLDK